MINIRQLPHCWILVNCQKRTSPQGFYSIQTSCKFFSQICCHGFESVSLPCLLQFCQNDVPAGERFKDIKDIWISRHPDLPKWCASWWEVLVLAFNFLWRTTLKDHGWRWSDLQSSAGETFPSLCDTVHISMEGEGQRGEIEILIDIFNKLLMEHIIFC